MSVFSVTVGNREQGVLKGGVSSM